MIYSGHAANIQCILVSDITDTMYSGSWDNSIVQWSLTVALIHLSIIEQTDDETPKDGRCLMTYKGHHDAVVAIRLAQRQLFSASNDHTLKRWNIEVRRMDPVGSSHSK